YDCYQSIQKSAGMDLASLRKNYGRRLALWGGVQVENLIAGTAEDVRRDVREAFRIALDEAEAGQGGFILGTSHSVAVGTKYDNFMALLDEAVKLNARYFD
ncbi:MAG TPA: uroporphyrinogen decarboxylase family protein, partial [Candidatus Glassbacteria bacterium]|nr:uroporphyrinogen decarboxylase family protein [Candidatus Glassbacteria bacterium]